MKQIFIKNQIFKIIMQISLSGQIVNHYFGI